MKQGDYKPERWIFALSDVRSGIEGPVLSRHEVW